MMTLYGVVFVELPTKKGEYEGESETLLCDPLYVLAGDRSTAQALAQERYAAEYEEKLPPAKQLKVICIPFEDY